MTKRVKTKVYSFEYMVYKLLTRVIGTDIKIDHEYTEFNKIKLANLHFFITAVKATPENSTTGLQSIFNDFTTVAMGYEDSVVYNNLKDFKYFELRGPHIKLKAEYVLDDNYVPIHIQTLIDESIEALLAINPKILKLQAFDLIEISHKWLSWKLGYKLAQDNNTYYTHIPKEIIQTEQKYFHL